MPLLVVSTRTSWSAGGSLHPELSWEGDHKHTQHLCVCSGSCSGGLDIQISCMKLSSASQAVPEVVVNVGA